jgi:hypothetical protein
MKNIVTDGQLVALTKRQNELYKRVTKGTIPIQPVLEGLQILIEGGALTNPGTYRTFSMKIGGATPEQLRWLMQRRGIDNWPFSAINSPDFITSATEWNIDLITLSPRDLGFIHQPTTSDLFDSESLVTWSVHNLDDQVLGLCPPEIGVQLVDRFADFLSGESVTVAMNPLLGVENIPVIFVLTDEGEDFKCQLNVTRSYPFYKFRLDQQILFQLMPAVKS